MRGENAEDAPGTQGYTEANQLQARQPLPSAPPQIRQPRRRRRYIGPITQQCLEETPRLYAEAYYPGPVPATHDVLGAKFGRESQADHCPGAHSHTRSHPSATTRDRHWTATLLVPLTELPACLGNQLKPVPARHASLLAAELVVYERNRPEEAPSS